MAVMRAIVLGSAAGGAFPQWNCGCANCIAVRAGEPGYEARTQDSLAISAQGNSQNAKYALINASPDVLVQIQKTRALWPLAPRHSPISAVVLTNGDMDHVLGLFCLRESWPLALYATAPVLRGLEESVFLRTLRRFDGQLVTRELVPGRTTELADAAGEPLGLNVRPFATPGKLPVHFVGHAPPSPADSVGLVFDAGGPSLAYATACGSLERVDRVDFSRHAAILFDGTFYREDELVRLGLSKAMAKDMAHMPIDGPGGSMAGLAHVSTRKIYTHINNTNPILAPASDERRAVIAAGWEIAHDGMEIAL